MTHDYEAALEAVKEKTIAGDIASEHTRNGDKWYQTVFTKAQTEAIKSALQLAMDSGWREIIEGNLPELKDDSVLVHFENGSIETVHIEDYFKDMTAGFDEDGKQKFVKGCFVHNPAMTHWQPLPQPPEASE